MNTVGNSWAACQECNGLEVKHNRCTCTEKALRAKVEILTKTRSDLLDELDAVKGLLWVECPHCDNKWCNIHKMHAFECDCTPIGEVVDVEACPR